jgi:integrase
VRHGEIDPLNHEEIPVFLDAVRTHATRCYTLFLCAIHTGLRAGELSGLQWPDIDHNGKFITVQRASTGFTGS